MNSALILGGEGRAVYKNAGPCSLCSLRFGYAWGWEIYVNIGDWWCLDCGRAGQLGSPDMEI